jgi:LDH2 family malate/lactate/ureidoglycolate dehydrogenase
MTTPAAAATVSQVRVGAEQLRQFTRQLLRQAGLGDAAAGEVAEALVDADRSGRGSHGVMQLEGYLPQLRAGGISKASAGELVVDDGAIGVLDAGHILGHLAAAQAMALAVERARRFGIGAIAVRHGTHFGVAGRYSEAAARDGCIGISLCNTRAVMPAPGGAQALVGTNPIAIAIPTARGPAIVLDMATTEGSVGKLRIAAKAGTPIPPTWAVTSDGAPTTDAAEALKGLLLPSGGPKGFGLALAIDLICGLLSSGAWGEAVPPIRDTSRRPDCSYFFIAIHVSHFRALDDFLAEAQGAADRVRGSKRAPGVERILVPGERTANARAQNADEVSLERGTVEMLRKAAQDLGVDSSALFGG